MADSPMNDVPIDPMLQVLVYMANEHHASFGISLLVGGTWICGTLIAPRTFTKELGDMVQARATGDGGETFRAFFDTIGTTWFPSESEREAKGENPDDAAEGTDHPHHAHLRGARSVVDFETSLPDTGNYARIRLDQVAGWMIGEIGQPRSWNPPPDLDV